MTFDHPTLNPLSYVGVPHVVDHSGWQKSPFSLCRPGRSLSWLRSGIPPVEGKFQVKDMHCAIGLISILFGEVIIEQIAIPSACQFGCI